MNYIHCIIILFSFTIFSIYLTHKVFELRRKDGVNIKGEASINKNLYHNGKIAVSIVFCFAIVESILNLNTNFSLSLIQLPSIILIIVSLIMLFGALIIIVSYKTLNSNLRLGLPRDEEDTELVTIGIYKISRNPIYIGFYLMITASMIYVINPVNIICGVVGIIIHHKQVLSEESFLSRRFKSTWEGYISKVRRYI